MKSLRALIIEDSEPDVLLALHELKRNGYELEYRQVETAKDLKAALREATWDVVLSDHDLPQFSAPAALALIQEMQLDLPFIIVSGRIEQDTAIHALKAGAHDYIRKDELPRLAPAIQRELEQAAVRRRHREALAALRESEARFRHLLECLPNIAVQGYRADGTILYWNQANEKVYGYTAAEALGRDLVELIIPPEMRADVRAAIRHGAATGEMPPAGELSLLRKDGSRVPVFSSHAVVRLPNRPPELFCIDIDLTESKRAAVALRQSEANFQELFHRLDDGIGLCCLTPEGIPGPFIEINEASGRMLGYAREEMLQLTPLAIEAPVDPAALALRFARIESQGRARFETELQHRDGRRIPVETHVQLLEFNGRPAILSFVRDITERKRFEAQVRLGQKMEAIGHLAGGVAHDFNNLLTVIEGNAGLLQAAGGLSPDSVETVGEIADAAKRAAGLTRQLLAFSRRQVLQLRTLDLKRVLADMAKMLHRILGETITAHFDCDLETAGVDADENMMEQVIMNLAVNAHDAMPRGGVLRFDLEAVRVDARYAQENPEARPGEFICLSVTDTGCGMDAATMPRIFDPFFTTKERGQGNGFGLSVVYGIVKQHEGWIEVSSAVGQGTTFKVFLPRSPKPIASQTTAAPEPMDLAGHETILVVEDEAAVRQLVARCLRRNGYTVLEAADGPAALEIWREHGDNIDLTLTDLVMPCGMSGRELVERLRQDRPALKALYSTGYSVEAVSHGLHLVEGENYLPKPYPSDRLLRVLRRCLNQH